MKKKIIVSAITVLVCFFGIWKIVRLKNEAVAKNDAREVARSLHETKGNFQLAINDLCKEQPDKKRRYLIWEMALTDKTIDGRTVVAQRMEMVNGKYLVILDDGSIRSRNSLFKQDKAMRND